MPNGASVNHLLSEKIALYLALFGYVPFFALAMAIGPLNEPLAALGTKFSLPSWFFAHVLAVYGAVILSFLGGIRWGVAMVGEGAQNLRRSELILSVLPSLAGWAAVFMARSQGLYFLGLCFVIQGLWDIRLTNAGRAPDWFGKLRIILTVLVSATLFAAGFLA